MIFICSKCHEGDKDVTGCTSTIDIHVEVYQMFDHKCGICGNKEKSTCCEGYIPNKKLKEKV